MIKDGPNKYVSPLQIENIVVHMIDSTVINWNRTYFGKVRSGFFWGFITNP